MARVSRRERVAARFAALPDDTPAPREGVIPLAVGRFRIERIRRGTGAKRRAKLRTVR